MEDWFFQGGFFFQWVFDFGVYYPILPSKRPPVEIQEISLMSVSLFPLTYKQTCDVGESKAERWDQTEWAIDYCYLMLTGTWRSSWARLGEASSAQGIQRKKQLQHNSSSWTGKHVTCLGYVHGKSQTRHSQHSAHWYQSWQSWSIQQDWSPCHERYTRRNAS